jgi:hypothetical protein
MEEFPEKAEKGKKPTLSSAFDVNTGDYLISGPRLAGVLAPSPLLPAEKNGVKAGLLRFTQTSPFHRN